MASTRAGPNWGFSIRAGPDKAALLLCIQACSVCCSSCPGLALGRLWYGLGMGLGGAGAGAPFVPPPSQKLDILACKTMIWT